MTVAAADADADADADAHADAAEWEASRHYCRRLTRAAARNFYYGLRLLPEPKRSAMFTLYAYMRLVDDIADRDDGASPRQRTADLDLWRERTHAALDARGPAPGTADRHRIWPAFARMVATYHIPAAIFDAAIAGQQQDLTPGEFRTFAELREYCYRVAGVVGLGSLHVWGYEGGAQTEDMAVALGVAFQLTNILRDVREDLGRGRVYLPTEDLVAAGVTADDLHAGRGGPAFERLVRIVIGRAEAHYRAAEGLADRIDPDARPTLLAMTEIYRRLLAKVSASPQAVLRKRVSLSKWSKLRIGWQARRASRALSRAASREASSRVATGAR